VNLNLLRHAQGKNRVESWERQVHFPLICERRKDCDYICDFLVTYADGRKELLDMKSPATMTPLFKFKLKFFKATFLRDHPD